MPATIFAGTRVKALKSTLNLNGGADIISSSVDPTSSATEGEPGSLLLNTTSGKLYRKNDSGSSTNWSEVGSGGSGINYVTNPSAATNTTGWSTYADAAGAQPVDGTGGSPTVTWTRSTTTPLRGAGDFNFTKDAANRQGEGVATDITIDLADQAKVLTVSFDYEVLSGTYATGDLTVYLIADPSGTPVVIQPAGYQIQSGTAGTKLKQIATFQTQATGQSYRVCFHVASTSAFAYSLAIDNVVVGPQTVQYGAPVTDWVDAGTITITGSTTNPTKGTTTKDSVKWRRVGDSMEILFEYAQNTAGTAGSGDYRLGIPGGFSIDPNKIEIANALPKGSCGIFTLRLASGFYEGQVHTATSNALFCTFVDTASATGSVGVLSSVNSPFTNNPLQFTAVVRVPILGWSSTVQMSNDVSTRAVEFSVSQSTGATTTISSTPTKIANLNSVLLDTLNGWNVANSRYVIPVPGVYTIKASLFIPTSPSPRVILGILKNGAQAGPATTTYALGTLQCEVKLQCVAGDYIEIYGQLESGTLAVGGFSTTNFSVALSQGPSAIAATESVIARYRTTTFSGTTGIVILTAKQIDTHGAYNTSTGVWTCPVSGIYLINGFLQSGATAYGVGGYLEAYASIDGAGAVSGFILGGSRAESVSAINRYATGSMTIRLNAGQTVSLYQSSSTSTAPVYAALDIVRVGN